MGTKVTRRMDAGMTTPASRLVGAVVLGVPAAGRSDLSGRTGVWRVSRGHCGRRDGSRRRLGGLVTLGFRTD
jgi:hypothetical protein